MITLKLGLKGGTEMSENNVIQNQENTVVGLYPILVNIKVKLTTIERLQELVQEVKKIEKEHNVSCTLDVEIGY